MSTVITKTEKVTALKEWLKKTELDGNVVNRTIGTHASSISPGILLETSKKLIKINRQEVEPDSRDDLRFMTFHGIEDFVKDHINRDVGKLGQRAKMKIQQKKDLSWLQPGFFSSQIKSVIIGNKLTQSIEGHNPIDNLDISNKITKLGEGGITSMDAIPDETRAVHASHFGLLDNFRVSESTSVGVDHRAAHNVVKGRDNKLYRLLLDKDKKPVWVDHETMIDSKVELPAY